jgi:antitoxin component of RelBE/YafQ-DinJ toxin-antitoxin module
MSSTQVKVTLPLNLFDYLQAKTKKFGLSMSAYLKHLIIEDVKDMEIPEFNMSQSTENTTLQALEDFKAGKLKKARSVDDLFK